MTTNTNQRIDLFEFVHYTMQVTALKPMRLWAKANNGLYYLGLFLDITYELFGYFTTMQVAMLHMCTLYIYFSESDLEFLINTLIQTVIYMWGISMKIYFRRVRMKLITETVDYINLKYQLRSASGFTYVTMDEAFALATWYSRIFVYWSYLATIFWLLLPMVYGDKSLPLNCWYPFDYRQPYIYEVVYFFQAVAQIHIGAAFSASSSMYMSLTILLSGQYDMLCCSLKNVVATTYIHAGAERDDLLRLQEAQQVADDEVNQYYCAKEHTCPIETLLAEQSDKGIEAKDFSSAFKSIFQDCIYHHRFILGALDKIERLYSPIWLIKVGEVTFLVCLVTFVSVKSTNDNSFMRMVTLWQYLVLVLLELLIICYFSDVAYQNSQRCGEAVLRSPWYLHMREMRSDLLFFLVHGQRPFKLTAGKIYDLNVERFRGSITTAFSFLTLLQKMDRRN